MRRDLFVNERASERQLCPQVLLDFDSVVIMDVFSPVSQYGISDIATLVDRQLVSRCYHDNLDIVLTTQSFCRVLLNLILDDDRVISSEDQKDLRAPETVVLSSLIGRIDLLLRESGPDLAPKRVAASDGRVSDR